ncbi:MAG: radical SAM protein [Candidatus Paceibacterota bacterium]
MKTMLFNGLPAVYENGKWIIVSASFGDIVSLSDEEIYSSEVRDILAKRGFFEIQKDQDANNSSLVTLITTSDCNLNCRYCFANSGVSRKNMSSEIAIASIERAIKNAQGKKLAVSFFGGEPTITEDLIKEVVVLVNEKTRNTKITEVEFCISTNGMTTPSFLNFLIENNFTITLSMDGIPKIQDYQRPLKNGGKSSEIVEKTIRHLVSRNKEFMIRSTITDYSVDYMVQMIEWLHRIGAKKVHFEPISIAGRAAMIKESGKTLKKPSAKSFIENLKESIIRGNELGVSVLNFSYMNLVNTPQEFCNGIMNNRFAVSYTGDITTCVEVQDKCHPAAETFILGKYSHKTKQIITLKDMRGHACKTIANTLKNEDCTNCFAKNVCGGGCPVRNFHTTGDSIIVDPYWCELVKEMLPFVLRLLAEETFDK